MATLVHAVRTLMLIVHLPGALGAMARETAQPVRRNPYPH